MCASEDNAHWIRLGLVMGLVITLQRPRRAGPLVWDSWAGDSSRPVGMGRRAGVLQLVSEQTRDRVLLVWDSGMSSGDDLGGMQAQAQRGRFVLEWG